MNTVKSLKEKIDSLQLEKAALSGCIRAIDEYINDLNKVIKQIQEIEV